MSPFVEGVRDILPEEIQKRKLVYQKLREIFAKNGYQEVKTPTFESLDLYMGTEQYFLKDQMFKVVDEKGQILVLKPDITLPIARMAVTRYSKFPKPWKFSYITTAYQVSGGQGDKMKEKTQAGIEFLGGDGIFADVEVIILLINALKAVGIKNPLIDIGQVALIEEIFVDLKIPDTYKTDLINLLEKKNKQEISDKVKEWNLGIEAEEILTYIPNLFGDPGEVLGRLRNLPLNDKGKKIVNELEEIYECLKALNFAQYIGFDPGMIKNPGYYTGISFKAYVSGYGEVIANGGRYDGLTGRFGYDVSAIGFAIEIDRLLNCLRLFNIQQTEREPTLLFRVSSKNDFITAQKIAHNLRLRGITVEVNWCDDTNEYIKFYRIDYVGYIKEEGFELIRASNQQKKKFTSVLDAVKYIREEKENVD